MRTRFSMSVIIVAALLFISIVVYAQPRSRGGWGEWGYDAPRERPWNYCPECGRPWGPHGGRGMDPGGRWEKEHRMEPEPEERGYGPGREPGHDDDDGPYHPGYQYPPYERERRKPLDEGKAKRMMQGYLGYAENPNSKLGEVREKEGFFEGEIVTKSEGDLVDRVIIDKRTGRM